MIEQDHFNPLIHLAAGSVLKFSGVLSTCLQIVPDFSALSVW